MFLGFGAFLKHPGWLGAILVIVATFFLILTAKVEELENLSKFGVEYAAYMKKTKMFVHFMF